MSNQYSRTSSRVFSKAGISGRLSTILCNNRPIPTSEVPQDSIASSGMNNNLVPRAWS